MIGLVMIVKNEEAVIERALLSAKPWITSWVIVDTGSTDRTKEVIRSVMSDISGLLVDREWQNFGANRTEALELCRGRMDWAIMLDADDNLAGDVPTTEFWNNITVNPTIIGLAMQIHHGDLVHQRAQVFRVAADWCYKGVLHEVPYCRTRPDAPVAMMPVSSYMVTRCEGARSKDPNKYMKDAAILEAEWSRDPTDARTTYYVAQSWRDAGRKKRAAHFYRLYLDCSGGWGQERYMAYVNLIGLIDDHEEKLALAWRAIEIAPNRLEAQYSVLKERRLAGLPVTRQVYALGAFVQNRKVADIVYVNPALYAWAFDDEFAVVAFAVGRYREAYDASVRVALAAVTPEMRENALKNAEKTAALL